MANCTICGKKLTRPESVQRGIGEICEARLASFERMKDDTNADYYIEVMEIKGEKVGLVIDCDCGGRTVTNAVEDIARKNGVSSIIYRDSEGIYDFWSPETQYRTLAIDGEPEVNLYSAIETARKRYLDDIGGLFT